MSFLDSLGRGAAQGATSGFSDEAVSRILAALPGPNDGTGIPREYAAGSAQQDYQNTERGDNARAAADNPVAYGVGSLAGALPSALAVPAGAGGSAAARVAAGGLTGGLLGGLSGAGHADGRDVAQEAAKGAAMGGALGTGGAAAIESLPGFAQQALASMRGPQMAAEGAGAGGAQVNKAMGMLPPRPTTGDMPKELFVPRAPKNIVPEEAIDAAEDLADASMASNTAEAALGGERASQKAARAEATKNFIEKTGSARKPPVKQTEKSVAATVPPKGRARKAAAAPAVDPGQTVRAPAPKFTVPPSTPPAAATVPAPAAVTVPAPASPTVPAPAPDFSPTMRPTMMDLGPVKPTLRPDSAEAYKDAIMKEIADSARRNSL